MTRRGRQQAQQLADRLAAEHIDLSVTSATLRAVESSEIVARALSIPIIKTPLLDDPPAGIFEDGPVEAFVEWMTGCDPDASVPGTSTSFRDAARRYFDAVMMLLTRQEHTILVIAHAPALRWIVQAAQGRTDSLNYRHPLFGHADPAEVDVLALRSRLDTLASDPFVVFSGQPDKES